MGAGEQADVTRTEWEGRGPRGAEGKDAEQRPRPRWRGGAEAGA